MSSIVPPLKNLTFTLCLSVLRSSSFIPDIIESPTMATVPFGHFTSVTLLYYLILCERSVCLPILRFKKFFISAINVLFIFVVIVVIVLVFTVIVVDVVIAIVVFVSIIIVAVDAIIGLGCFGDRICRCRNISGGTDYFWTSF